MSQAYLDGGLIPRNGYINASPAFIPEFVLNPAGGSATSQSIYVSVGGSDTNPGSIALPFATLQGALTKRNTLPNTTYVTIFVLPGSYDALNAPVANVLTVPDNTAIVGVPTGILSESGREPTPGIETGASPVIFTGRINLGSDAVVVLNRILLSGLDIIGEVDVVGFRATVFLYACHIKNYNGNILPYTGSAVRAGDNSSVYIDNCNLVTNNFLKEVVFSSGTKLQITSSVVIMNSTGPSVSSLNHLVYYDGGGTFNLTNSEVISYYSGTAIAGSLVYFGGNNIVSRITNSTLRYISSAVVSDGSKVCIYNSQTNNMTVTNCYLLQPGGRAQAIYSPAPANTTLTYAANYGVSGKNAQTVQSATALATIP
jgi:hypothetical protein